MRFRIATAVIILAEIGFALHNVPPQRFAAAPRAIKRVVVLGDSVAHGAGDERGGGIAQLLGAVNLAVNGSRTWDVAKMMRGAAARTAIANCDAVVLSAGGNDLFGDQIAKIESIVWPSMMMTRTMARLDALVATVHRLNPHARVYLLGLYNPYRRSTLASWLDRQVAIWDARLIAHFADQPSVDVVRIADLLAFSERLSRLDHFHPGHDGYALIAQRIAMTW